MIVSENNISTALEYLAIDPHPFALARKDVTDAESKCKELFARAFLAGSGGAESRKAQAETDGAYRAARSEEAQALLNLERSRSRTKAAEMLIEVWRTEQSNARVAGRVT